MFLNTFRSISKPVLVVLLLAVVVASCKHRQRKKSPSGFSDETFSEHLETVLKPVDTTGGKKPANTAEYLRYTYQLADYQPLWLKENYTPSEAAGKLVKELADVEWDGFDPLHYRIDSIMNLMTRLDTSKIKSLRDAVAFDTFLTRSYLQASKDLLVGTYLPKKVDTLWFHANDSSWNAPELLTTAKAYPSLDSFRSKLPTYKLLRAEYRKYSGLVHDTDLTQAMTAIDPAKLPDSLAWENINLVIKTKMPWVETAKNDSVSEQAQLIMAFQQYRNIKATGKLDSTTYAALKTSPADYMKVLRANMERMRWMQRDFGNLYIIVDVPLMEFFMRRNDTDLMHMNVVVGKPVRQTPSLFANMANVVINPPWGVPPTILKNDVVPGFAKSGKQYLAKKGLRAYDREGRLVNPANLNAKNLKRFTYRQAPGDDNALGYVKFNLPNKWDIYLHDTPHRTDFGKRDRALSSGCIRLSQPQELAVYILSQFEKRDYTPEKLQDIIRTHKTRWEILKNKIPVLITYLTVFEDSTHQHVQFTRDIYHRDDKLIAAMNS